MNPQSGFDSIKVERSHGDLLITRKWYVWVHWIVTGFCLFWDGLLVLVFQQVLKEDPVPWAFVALQLGHLATALLLTYYVAVGFLNKTVIEVSGGKLTVRHGPLPWTRRNVELPVDNLAQFFVLAQPNWEGTFYYQLCCVLKDGEKVLVLPHAANHRGLKFLEQTLEAHIGLRDQPVDGELGEMG